MKEHLFEDRIYYRTNEWKRDRPTLVLAHGVSGSSSAWGPYEKIFEKKYNVLSYDIRGHGLSKKYPHYEDYEIKNFAEDLHDLVTFLKIKKFVLISNSFAGLVHLQYLKLHGDSVVVNIFTSPEIYLNKGFLAKIIRSVLALIKWLLKILPFNPKPRGHVDYKEHIGSTDWDIARTFADIKNTGLHAHFYTLKQSFTPEQKYSLEKINVPTLIIHGERDTMVPLRNVMTMHKKIKNSEFLSIQGIDHNTVHNAVKIMSETIESFLEKNKKSLLFS